MSQLQSISIHKNKSNYDAKQKKFRNSLANLQAIINSNNKNEDASECQRKISKAQTYRLLNCIKVLEYLKDYEIQPCNERICRALKQYGKNKENICKLWQQVLSSVNNKKEAINSILVKNIWSQMNNNNSVSNSSENMNMSNNYYNNYNQEQMNNSYPTPDKNIFIKDNYNNNSMANNCLPSPECKPMFMENNYNNYNNNSDFNNNYVNNIYSNNMNSSVSSSSSSSEEFSYSYPALYKPAWTISIEQLRNGSESHKNNNNNNNINNYNNYNNNAAFQYPSPTSSPSSYNNYNC